MARFEDEAQLHIRYSLDFTQLTVVFAAAAMAFMVSRYGDAITFYGQMAIAVNCLCLLSACVTGLFVFGRAAKMPHEPGVEITSDRYFFKAGRLHLWTLLCGLIGAVVIVLLDFFGAWLPVDIMEQG